MLFGSGLISRSDYVTVDAAGRAWELSPVECFREREVRVLMPNSILIPNPKPCPKPCSEPVKPRLKVFVSSFLHLTKEARLSVAAALTWGPISTFE